SWTIDADMIAGAKLFRDACLAPLGPWNVSSGHYEQRVDIPRVHAECWGTPDFWTAVFPEDERGSKRYVRVVDYKYGHRFVEVFENLQLAAYASGVLSQLSISTGDDET